MTGDDPDLKIVRCSGCGTKTEFEQTLTLSKFRDEKSCQTLAV